MFAMIPEPTYAITFLRISPYCCIYIHQGADHTGNLGADTDTTGPEAQFGDLW